MIFICAISIEKFSLFLGLKNHFLREEVERIFRADMVNNRWV
jgi:hypothetical protein